MKKRFLPLSMLLITIVLAQANFVANAAGDHGKYTPRTGSKATFSSFMKSIRANQETGLIDPALMMAGRKAAQTQSRDGEALAWSYAGPDNYGGMTRAMLYNNDGTVLIGTMGGNIFKTTNGGITFGRVTNFNFPISCMVKGADGIYVGTGDGLDAVNFNGLAELGYETSFIGSGIFKLEGNELVLVNNTENIQFVNEMAVAGNDVYAATSNGLIKVSDPTNPIIAGNFRSVKANNNGDILAADANKVYLVKNGNVTDITNIIDENTNTNPKIIAMAPTDANIMYVAYLLGSAGSYQAGNFYFTTDGGTTWVVGYAEPSTTANQLYPFFGSDANHDGFMIVYPNNPRKLLIGSDDLWTMEDATGMGVNSFKPTKVSLNGTSSYSSIYLHQGIHNVVFNPSNPNTFFVGTTGGVFKGIYKQSNYTYTSCNRYYISDEEHTSVTRMMNVGIGGNLAILGGCLDHGTVGMVGSEYVNNITTGGNVFPHPTNNAYQSTYFTKDYAGGPCAISTINPYMMFVSTTGNLTTPIYRTETASEDFDQNFEGGDDPIIKNANAFRTPYVLFENYNDANNPVDTIYAPIRTVKHKDDVVFAYSIQAGYPVDYTLGEPPHDAEHLVNGEYVWIAGDTIRDIHDPISTLYLVGIEGKVYMTREALIFNKETDWLLISDDIEGIPTTVAMSSDGNTAMIGTVEGNLYKLTGIANAYTAAQASVDSTASVVTLTTLTPISTQAVTGISIDPTNSNNVLVSLGNYGNSNYLYRSTNGGSSFSPLTTGLPAGVPVYSCLIAKTNDENNSVVMLAGTEVGLYAYDGSSWQPTGEVKCPIMDLKQAIQPNHPDKIDILYDEMGDATLVLYPGVSNEGMIYAATYGAGIIKCEEFLADPVFGNESDDPTTTATEVEELNIYPNPVRDFAQFDITIDNSTNVSYVIYDLAGRLMSSNDLGSFSAGTHTLNIETKDLSKGSYIIRVKAGEKTETGKFLVY